jgi:hypothetical protein
MPGTGAGTLSLLLVVFFTYVIVVISLLFVLSCDFGPASLSAPGFPHPQALT